MFAFMLMFGIVAQANAAAVNVSLTLKAVGAYEDDQTTYYNQYVSPNSLNSNVAKAEMVGTKVRITAVGAGTTTVTYRAYNTKTSQWDDITVAVTVDLTSSTTTTTATADPNALTVPVGQKVETTTAYESVRNVTTTNSSIARADWDSTTKKIVVRGYMQGTATISFDHAAGVGVAAGNKSLTVTVTPAGSSTGTPLAIGATYSVGPYYEITSATSSSDAIATVALDKATSGAHKATVTGVADGEVTITVKYRAQQGAAEQSTEVKLAVGTAAQGTSTSTTADTSGSVGISTVKVASSKIPANTQGVGIYFSKNKFSIATGKTSSLSSTVIRLNGKAAKANSLRWVAEDSSIISVNSSTGAFKALKAGESKLFATDKDGKYLNSVTIVVK